MAVTLEIFTSVIVAYRCPEMGTGSTASAVRAMYIVVMLFSLTAVIGGTCDIPLGLCWFLDGWQAYHFGSQGGGRL